MHLHPDEAGAADRANAPVVFRANPARQVLSCAAVSGDESDAAYLRLWSAALRLARQSRAVHGPLGDRPRTAGLLQKSETPYHDPSSGLAVVGGDN